MNQKLCIHCGELVPSRRRGKTCSTRCSYAWLGAKRAARAVTVSPCNNCLRKRKHNNCRNCDDCCRIRSHIV